MFENLKLEIDPLRLEDEWQQHPSQYGFWAESAVEAQDVMDRAKAKFDQVTSRLDSEIRENPDGYGIKKATEGEVKNALPRQPEYLAAQSAYLDAKKEYNRTQAALQSLEHRKRALSMLVELYVREYYAEGRYVEGAQDKRMTRRRAMDRSEEGR